ncbi:MAG: hypothetical protein A3A58_02930 [Candidatus Blackburnbacteria bacterium RIFCSPLOWO2_01_FULL_41_27]|uniref:SH3b domain-containing protein n=2 Tax=Candidatus Blackburniibacteriota TaxID=1817898 RepID=A0A1G1V693_9BACT|nr:MAG: hypothetical protein A3F61_01955 [Candidatus Blackburnbacteria bacterium RIFCSPHIGHO2_12_FULL_41_13b]OGY12887.1 MAG: hypothetical protein A3A58_02930 [Candidatus Blackburnbacteria bacterium RIFCSPLOWO2_01_FULL_41_27]
MPLKSPCFRLCLLLTVVNRKPFWYSVQIPLNGAKLIMQRKWMLVMGVILMLLGAGGFLLFSKLKPAQAGLQIETTPQATVYIDGDQMGTTPFELVQKPGEVSIRLVPIATETSLAPWGTKVTLVQGIKTVIRRDFAENEEASAGEILSFEKRSGNTASLTVVSAPDAAQVNLDGQNRGFTPLPVNDIAVGEHKLIISQAGYSERQIQARAGAGYKLTVVAMLAKLDTVEANEESALVEELQREKVKIAETPTGFLRVRSAPTKNATESGQVKPGEEYVLLEEKDSWYKIEYQKDKEGWVSSEYVKKVE